MNRKGLFITFEGGEGAGKTTQINILSSALNEAGHAVVTTREPGGTPESEKIRNLLVQRSGGQWSPMAECLLLFAARDMHVRQVIKPALEDKQIVISDRFTDSTRAYQGYGHGLELKKIEALNKTVLNGFEPDLTFILDIDTEAGLKRSGRRLAAESLQVNQTEDRFESLEIAFHERLRQGFLKIAKQNRRRCHVIDATQSSETIATQIKNIVLRKLK